MRGRNKERLAQVQERPTTIASYTCFSRNLFKILNVFLCLCKLLTCAIASKEDFNSLQSLHVAIDQSTQAVIIHSIPAENETSNETRSFEDASVVCKSAELVTVELCSDSWNVVSTILKDHSICSNIALSTWCEKRISTMPKIPKSFGSLGSFYLTVPKALDDVIASNEKSGEHRFLRKDFYFSMEGVIEDVGDWRNVPSPMYLPARASNYPHEAEEKEATVETFSAFSSAAVFGEGMHRTLQHNIDFYVRDEDIRNGSVVLLFPLTENVYIDLDEPSPEGKDFGCVVSHGMKSCRIELLTPIGHTIDIEQPSFSSRQHAIALKVNFSSQSKEKVTDDQCANQRADFCIKFLTSLHIRYQNSFTEGGRVILERLVNISIPDPFVFSGLLQDRYGSHHVFFPESDIIGTQLRIATPVGLDGDYWSVVICTSICSLFGTILLIKNTFLISKWQ